MSTSSTSTPERLGVLRARLVEWFAAPRRVLPVTLPLLAVVLTGMGSDGRRGAQYLKAKGASVLAQDEATSVVWGMPGAVTQAGLADEVLPLDRVAEAIVRALPARRPAGLAGVQR